MTVIYQMALQFMQ